MYSNQETAILNKTFWTSFGVYMRPLPGSEGQMVNWLNYKTGIKHVFFRMDVDNKQARIAIEMRHKDPALQLHYFQLFEQLKTLLHETVGEEWQWDQHAFDEDGKPVSRVSRSLNGVNIFNKADWPAIISFLKPRIQALDAFWNLAKERFE